EPGRAVILVLRRARNPDAAFLNLLRALHERLHPRGVTLLLCGVQAPMRRALADTGLDAPIGERHILRERAASDRSTAAAVQAADQLLGTDLCSACPRPREEARAGRPSDQGAIV